jgi:undecaprenyl-diphosphatase
VKIRDDIETDRLVACSADPGLPGIEAAALPGAQPSRLDRLLALDAWLLLAMRHWQDPWRTRLALALTRLGDASSWTVAALALLATGTALGVRLGLRLAVATLLATAVSQTLKRWFLRPRPTRAIAGFTALAETPDAFSFPSGHTTAAFAVAAAFAGAGFGLGPASLALATGIGLSRVYLGAHYPLDVAVGAVLGSACGVAARLIGL